MYNHVHIYRKIAKYSIDSNKTIHAYLKDNLIVQICTPYDNTKKKTDAKVYQGIYSSLLLRRGMCTIMYTLAINICTTMHTSIINRYT